MATFETSDGLKLYYEDTGAGRPILCLSGLTRSCRDFDFVKPHLPGRVIAMDYRGRGHSDYGDYLSYTISQEAEDALGLMDHLGLDQVTLIGTSRGGLIAMYLAMEHSNRLRAVVLNDIGPVIEQTGIAQIMDYLGRRPSYKTHAEAASGQMQALAGDFPNVPLACWRAHVENIWTAGADGLQLRYDAKLRDAVLALSALSAPDLWPMYDALAKVPLAILRGENSNLFSPATLAEMVQRHPNAITTTIPDRGHVPFLDEPKALEAIGKLLEAS